MLGIIKSDARYAYVALTTNSIYSNNLEDFYGVDELLLPLNGTDNLFNIYNTNLNLLDILKINCIKKIYVGKTNNKLKELCDSKNIKLIELLKIPGFVTENAFLTACGIIEHLNNKDFCVLDYNIIIIGFGNIGYYLAKLLEAYRVNFSVYTISDVEKKFVRLLGYKEADFSNFDIVINTIPYNLDLDYKLFENKKVIDVASAPYGFDIEAISKMKVDYEILSSIPAKYYPSSAGKIIKKYIEFC